MTKNMQVDDLHVSIVDLCGNEVREDAKVTLRASSDSKVDLKPRSVTARTKNGQTKFAPFELKSHEGSEEYTLEVQAGSVEGLKPASLKCKVELGNEVCDMTHELVEPAKQYAVGTSFDARVKLLLSTEDRQPFEPDPAAFVVGIKLKGPYRGDAVVEATAKVTVGDLSATTVRWETEDGSEFVPTRSGWYTVKCQFQEMRMTQTASGAQRVPSVKFDVHVDAGPPIQLVVKQNNTVKSGATVNASNSGDPRHRLIINRPSVQALDRYNNNTALSDVPLNTPVVCSIRVRLEKPSEANEVAESEAACSMPRLEGIGSDNCLLCDSQDDKGAFRFQENISLQENVGRSAGEFRLVFCVLDASGQPPAATSVKSCYIIVSFQPDGERSEQLKLKCEELSAVKAELTEMHSKFNSTSQDFGSVDDKIESLVRDEIKTLAEKLSKEGDWGRQFAENLKPLIDKSEKNQNSTITSGEVEKLLEEVLQRQQKMESDFSGRREVMPKINQAVLKLGTPIVQLAFVADAKLATLLSWTLSSNLRNSRGPSIFARSTAELKKVINDFGLTCFAQEQIFTYSPRSDKEKQQYKQTGKVLLLPISEEQFRQHGNQVDGEDVQMPEFALNLLELPRNKEKLRLSLWHAICGSLMVMESLDQALEYRRVATKLERRVPTIVTRRDCKRLAGNGRIDPTEVCPGNLP